MRSVASAQVSTGDVVELRGADGRWTRTTASCVWGSGFQANLQAPGSGVWPPARASFAFSDENKTWRRARGKAVPQAPGPLEALGLAGSDLAAALAFF